MNYPGYPFACVAGFPLGQRRLTVTSGGAYISYAVRLIKPSTVREWADQYPDAASALAAWQRLMETHEFVHFAALRRVFPHAGQGTVASQRLVTVFNLRGNRYRLVVALHYNRQLCFALRFLTHAEYSKNHWKDQL